jgi:hypothetical protein
MRTIDALNRQHDTYTVSFAAAGQGQAWKLPAEHLSQRYTTRWIELPRV